MGIRIGNIDIKRPILKLPPDLSEYYNTTNITGNWQTLIKKLTEFEIPKTRTDLSSMFSSYKGTDIAYFDTSNVTDMSYMFYYCTNLKTIPPLNTSKVTNMATMFSNCSSLITIPQFDTSNVTRMDYMFSSCYKLQTIPQLDTSNVTTMAVMFSGCYLLTEIPQLDTSSVTTMGSMFGSCYNLQTIPQLDTSNVTSMGEMFRDCYNLVTLPELNCSKVISVNSMFNTMSTYRYMWRLTNIGGFKDLGKAYLTTASANYSNYRLDLQQGKNNSLTTVTYESLMNIINGLYDIASIGVQPQQLVLGPLTSKLSADEIEIATNKGWTIS